MQISLSIPGQQEQTLKTMKNLKKGVANTTKSHETRRNPLSAQNFSSAVQSIENAQNQSSADLSLAEIVQMGRMKEKGRWKRSEERTKEALRQISIGSAGGSRAGTNCDYLNLNRMNVKTAGNNSTRSNYSMRHIVFRDEESKMRTCTN